jgi:hypothetical protein
MRLFTFKLAIFKPFILETSTSGIEDIEHEFSEADPSPGSIVLLESFPSPISIVLLGSFPSPGSIVRLETIPSLVLYCDKSHSLPLVVQSYYVIKRYQVFPLHRFGCIATILIMSCIWRKVSSGRKFPAWYWLDLDDLNDPPPPLFKNFISPEARNTDPLVYK